MLCCPARTEWYTDGYPGNILMTAPKSDGLFSGLSDLLVSRWSSTPARSSEAGLVSRSSIAGPACRQWISGGLVMHKGCHEDRFDVAAREQLCDVPGAVVGGETRGTGRSLGPWWPDRCRPLDLGHPEGLGDGQARGERGRQPMGRRSPAEPRRIPAHTVHRPYAVPVRDIEAERTRFPIPSVSLSGSGGAACTSRQAARGGPCVCIVSRRRDTNARPTRMR